MDLSTFPKLETFHQQTTVYIDPSKLDAFWEAFIPVFEKQAAESECLYIEAFEDPAEPGKVIWVVNWNRSLEWLLTENIKKDYYVPYREATEPLYIKPKENVFLQREKPFLMAKKANFDPVIGENGEGFSLHITIHLKPECVDQFWDEWREIFELVVGEPECLYFEVFSDPTTPGKLSWIENWSKRGEWFMQNQMTKEYYKPYLAATEPMFAAPREVKILKRRPGMVGWKAENFEGANKISAV